MTTHQLFVVGQAVTACDFCRVTATITIIVENQTAKMEQQTRLQISTASCDVFHINFWQQQRVPLLESSLEFSV